MASRGLKTGAAVANARLLLPDEDGLIEPFSVLKPQSPRGRGTRAGAARSAGSARLRRRLPGRARSSGEGHRARGAHVARQLTSNRRSCAVAVQGRHRRRSKHSNAKLSTRDPSRPASSTFPRCSWRSCRARLFLETMHLSLKSGAPPATRASGRSGRVERPHSRWPPGCNTFCLVDPATRHPCCCEQRAITAMNRRGQRLDRAQR